MIKNKRLQKPFSVGLALLLAFSFIKPAFAESPGDASKIELKSGTSKITTAKVNQKLNKQFDQSEYVTYLVKLKEQVDTTSVSKQALHKATLQKVTPSAAKLSMRSSVVSSLRETASRTQYSLENYLQKEVEQGKVKEYKSYFIVNAFAVTSTKDVMDSIARQPEVDKILPNETRYLQKVEIDKQEAKEAADKANKASAINTGKSTGVQTDAKTGSVAKDATQPSNIEWNISHINAPEAWAKGIDGTGIVVANLDSGVDYTHPALHRKWRGLDASGNVVNPELSWYDASSGASLPVDGDGHGTHTMGTMVGSEENGSNQVGVAPGAKWIAVRIFNPDTTDAIILDGAQWLLAPVDAQGNLHPELAPDVVNNSWGGGAGLDEWFRPTVQAWRDAQIFPEFSAGNTTRTNPGGPASVANPANYPESFATGATDINDKLGSFSLLGPSPYGEIKPEVSAPGVNIRSSVPGGGYEGGWNGTSMAGPHTTALAALLLQANHSLTVDQLENIIMDTATPRTDSKYPTTPNNGYGHGVINVLDAVGSIVEGIGTVSGKVVTGGDDLEDPVLEHTAPTSAFTGVDVPLTAHVTDNVAVTSVDVFARTTGNEHYVYIPMEQTSGSSKDGTYQATIPKFLVEPAGLEYYIQVNDYGNNGFKSAIHKVAVSNGVKPGYIQNFEENFTGFTTGGEGSPWAWGTPVSGPGGAASGQKVIATNLKDTYASNSNAYLLAPPIDLTQSPDGALVSFKQWYDIENNIDFGKVYIATADSEYAFVPLLTFTGSSTNWKTQYIDLRPYAGQQVFLMFNLTSDASVQKAGWYMDDFSVQVPDHTAPGAPGGLRAAADSVGNVTLAWSAPSDEDLKQYKVYRSTQSGKNYNVIGNTAEKTFVDTVSVSGATYYYTVAAEDYSGNVGAKSNEVSLTVQVPSTLFSDHFDSSTDNGWTHAGAKDEWERGVPASPGPTTAVSPPNVWGTDLDGAYENAADYSLVSPSVNLRGIRNATLTFNHWFEIEGGYDYGYVEVSKNGGETWSELGKFSHNSNGKNWTPVYYNIDKYAGGEAQFRFRLQTDNTVNKAGWYIDDFRVMGISTPTVTKDVTPELSSVKEKTIYDHPLYKITRTEKSEFNEKVKPKETKVSGSSIGLASLPASATVTVVETGRSVKTDPSTGRYSFSHVAGDYTLKAEAYGYYPQTQKVKITDGTSAKATFNLQSIPHGVINGIVTDERTGEPVANAAVLVLEDAQVAPIRTGTDGRFTLDVQEGTYTLSVTASDYYSQNVTVTVPPSGSVEAAVALKPFIGFPGEIAYDDGTPENSRSFNAAGNGWAVRMTPESAAAQVTGASLRFWNTEWPTPGGTAFQYAVYDASGAEGAPGRKLAGPFDGTALRNNQWTTVNFAEPVNVQGDFYIVYIQTAAGTNSPGLATDENSTNAQRSWQGTSGAWSKSPAEEGNYMIRATVRYPVNAPVITTPTKDTYTNQGTINVTGTSPADGADIQLYNGLDLAGTAKVANRQFSLPVQLHAGENPLSVQAVVYGKATERSEPIIIILDQTKPDLVISSPVQGQRTNAGVVTVTGAAYDDHINNTVTINGESTDIGSDGSFAKRVLVDAGENTITVTATDRANNETTVTRSVYVDLALPELSNLSPAKDVHLTGGEPVEVSFDSAPGLHAGFRVEVPFNLSSMALARNEIPLTETSPGHYSATYVASSSLVIQGGVIVIRVRDAAGNEAEFETPGKLYVTNGTGPDPNPGPNPPTNNIPPVAVIQADNSAKKNKKVSFNGKDSHDADGKIISYNWSFGDGDMDTGAKVKHKFATAGSYQVELTVTDNKGAQNKAVHTIVIR